MSEIKVNKISPKQTCTQLTLGDSGDTIIIPAGATITNNGTANGFGRAGSVNWDTTPKTTGFTAVSGNGYFCNTTSAAFTVTLPATPTAGDIVAIADYNGTAGTNAITVSRNSSNINGIAANLIIAKNYSAVTLVYVDATSGWRSVDTSNISDVENTFIAATGGTVLTCGDYKTHVFTGPGTFTVTNAGNVIGSNSVEYLVVAGGGGGSYSDVGGGGGAGGFRQNYPSPTTAGLPVTATSYPITVGAGGAAVPGGGDANGNPGSNSIFSTITSTGGGGGGGDTSRNGLPGGSGGGGGHSGCGIGGSGNTPPVSPPQGNPGGNGTQGATGPAYGAGGGGGGGAAGSVGTTSNGGAGGIGSTTADTFFGPTSPSYGTPGPAPGRYFAGGGGGGRNDPGTPAAGGSGGGGGGVGPLATAGVGTANTGGGGGGIGNAPSGLPSGAGGSGIVVIRYKFQ